MPARAAEVAFLETYLAALIPRRCQGGIFAAKIHFGQFVKVLDNPIGRKLLDGGLFIHLFREDLLKQAVSAHFAHLTGRWSIDDTLSTVAAERPNFFDVATLDRTLQDLAGEDLGWRVFLARNDLSPISISYEQLCKDPYGFVFAIARRLGFDPAMLRQGYSESTAVSHADSDPRLPSRSEVTWRYLAAFRTLHEARPAPPCASDQLGPVRQQGADE